MTQTLMSLLWSCSCNQMLILFYVSLFARFFSFGLWGSPTVQQSVCLSLKETEIHKNEATGCQRRKLKLLQTLTVSVLALVSLLIHPLRSYFFLPSPSCVSLIQWLAFFLIHTHTHTLLRLTTMRLKKETWQHVAVPHSAGIINKSAEEEVNCCNRLIQPTPGDGEHF